MAELCVTFLCPRGSEERVIDLLLAAPGTTVLTSAPVTLHGLDPQNLDAAEQVLGGARAFRIEAIVGEADGRAVIDLLRAEAHGVGLRYWTQAIAEVGVIA